MIIRNLYTLHTCNNGKNVAEESTNRDTTTKNIFRQCFHQIEANLLVRITNHLTNFYVILNTDRKWAELKFFLYCLYDKKSSTNVKQQSTTLQISGSQSLFCSRQFSSFGLSRLALTRCRKVSFEEKLLSQNASHWLEQSSELIELCYQN